jgi:hypothetical protein
MKRLSPGLYTREQLAVLGTSYFEIEAVNQTLLKTIGKSPLHYVHRRTSDQPTTAPMRLGSAAHTAVLEPDRFMLDFAVYTHPDPEKKTRRAGNDYTEFCAANAHRTILVPKEYEAAQRISRAVRGSKLAMRYLRAGTPEVTMVWADARTSVLCKARIDWLSTSVADVMAELKTAADVGEWSFSSAFAKREYDVQTAFYADGYKALTGRELYSKCIAVESTEPHDVVVYDLAEVVDVGRELYAGYLDRLIECTRANQWPGQGTQEITLHLPRWRDPEDNELADLDLELGEAAEHG